MKSPISTATVTNTQEQKMYRRKASGEKSRSTPTKKKRSRPTTVSKMKISATIMATITEMTMVMIMEMTMEMIMEMIMAMTTTSSTKRISLALSPSVLGRVSVSSGHRQATPTQDRI